MTGHGTYIGDRLSIANEIIAERARQDAKWGEQNHDSVIQCGNRCKVHNLPTLAVARAVVETHLGTSAITWTDITLEELCEAVEASTEAERRAELVQLAAVVVAWIECIDRRTEKEIAHG